MLTRLNYQDNALKAPRFNIKKWRIFRALRHCSLVLEALCIVVQAYAAELEPPLVLRSGSGQVLSSTNLPFVLDASWANPLLAFDFGFATAETNAPATFFDSFSLTLQNAAASATALLLTADLFGVKWAPPNPGGIAVRSESIQHDEIPFGAVGAAQGQKYAYAVTLALPPDISGQAATFILDLFDNQNALGSLGYLSWFWVGPGPDISVPPAVLQSSAAVAGPYADEPGVQIDVARGTLTVPKLGRSRFYRMRSEAAVRIVGFRMQAGEVQFRYEFPGLALVLQSAPALAGPYSDEADVVWEAAQRRASVAQAAGERFYRIQSSIPVKVVRTEVAGGRTVLDYECRPAVLGLQSSALVGGPYSEEGGVKVDYATQTVSLSRSRAMRFYRLRSDVARRITRLRVDGERLIFHFE